MWLRKILGLRPRHPNPLESAFDPVERVAKPRLPAPVRAFASTPRQQAGGGLRRAGARDGHGTFARIVPFAGVIVP